MTLLRAASLVLIPTLTLGAVLLTGTADPLRAAVRAKAVRTPSARVVGIMINPRIDEGSEPDGFPPLAFQGSMARTKLALVVDDGEGGIIGLDRERSRVEWFQDDKGRSLLEEESMFSPFGFGERILRDGQRLAVELEGALAPSELATEVEAKGSLALRVAHEKRTWTTESRPWKKGKALAAGPFHFMVVASGKAQWGDGYELELETESDLSAAIHYVAIEPDGTRSELSVRSTMTFGNNTRMSLESDHPIEAAQLEIVAWHGAKLQRVPFRVSARVGFESRPPSSLEPAKD